MEVLFLNRKDIFVRVWALISTGKALARISAECVDIVLKLHSVVVSIQPWIDCCFVLHYLELIASILTAVTCCNIWSMVPFSNLVSMFVLAPQVNIVLEPLFFVFRLCICCRRGVSR